MTLSAINEIVIAPSSDKSQSQLQKDRNVSLNSSISVVSQVNQARESVNNKTIDPVTVELSASHEVFSAVDDFFNLGSSRRFENFHALSSDDKEQFVKIVAELAKSGYIGYEELLVNKKVERHEILSKIGDQRLRGAKVYDKLKYPRR